MAPFTSPKVVISGLKERFDSSLVNGKSTSVILDLSDLTSTFIADKLYLGSSTGNLHIYDLNDGACKCGSILAMV
jgi:Vam6/Vps39-like protein vacuolar protein sorting-associated protein 39